MKRGGALKPAAVKEGGGGGGTMYMYTRTLHMVLWSDFCPLIFQVYDIELPERIKTRLTICKYLN